MPFEFQTADCSSGDREEGHHDVAVVSCRMAALDDDGSESLSPPLKRCVVEDRETGLMFAYLRLRNTLIYLLNYLY